jgi:steroid Delta-isomerase
MSPETVSLAVKAYFAAIRDMNMDAWVETFAEDAVSNDPVGSSPIVGHQKLRDFFQSIAGAFEKVALTEDNVFIAGNGAAVKWTGAGTSKQGKSVRFEGIDVFEINEHGKIQRVYAYWNPAEMVAQL